MTKAEQVYEKLELLKAGGFLSAAKEMAKISPIRTGATVGMVAGGVRGATSKKHSVLGGMAEGALAGVGAGYAGPKVYKGLKALKDTEKAKKFMEDAKKAKEVFSKAAK